MVQSLIGQSQLAFPLDIHGFGAGTLFITGLQPDRKDFLNGGVLILAGSKGRTAP